MTLREGRADLHQRLNKAAAMYADTGQSQLVALLTDAAKATLTCPHDCNLCWQVERKEANEHTPNRR